MVQQFIEALERGASPVAIALAFSAGILASLTPCIYPVIPITVSFFAGRARSHLHALWLSVVYVSGMAIVYAVLGVAAALTGKIFGRITVNAPIYFSVGGLIFFFGLMQMGWIRLKTPFLNIGKISGQGSAFFMGVTSGFIVAPCTVPILGVILTYIAAQQNLLFGALLMFSFALGLGMLLMLLGIFTGALTRLPKSGRWMMIVEKGAGGLFLLTGAYFIYRAVSLI